MKEALRKFDDGGEGSEVDLGEVYDHLAYVEFQVRSNLVRGRRDGLVEKGLCIVCLFSSV